MLSSWADLLTVLVAVPILLFIARAWVSELPADTAGLLGTVGCFLLAFALTRLATSRLEFHRTDGVLTALALQHGEAARYLALLVAGGLVAGFALLLIVGAGGPLQWLLGAASGVAAGSLWGLLESRRSGRGPPRWLSGHRPSRLRRPSTVIALAVAAAVVVLVLQASLAAPELAAITMLASIAAAVFLGGVDAERVRFMALVGHSSLASVWNHCRALLAFFVPFALVLALSFDWLVAGTGLGMGLLSLAIVCARVLAYRVYRRQLADWIVAMLMAGVATAGITLPFAAPLFVLAAIAWLARRARHVGWLLA